MKQVLGQTFIGVYPQASLAAMADYIIIASIYSKHVLI